MSEPRTPGEIEQEIEQTRTRMDREIDELSERLRPRALAREVAGAAGKRVGRRASHLLEAIERNPLASAFIGLAVVGLVAGLLAAHRPRRRPRGWRS